MGIASLVPSVHEGETIPDGRRGRDLPLVFRRAGELYWAGSDHLGGTIRVMDSSFAAVDGMRYEPYGEDRDSGDSLNTDRKFTGQTEDQSIGLYWYQSRAYDPEIGRFCSPDVVVPAPANPQSLNRYSYVYNNPLKYVDKTGNVPTAPPGGPWIAMDLYIRAPEVEVPPFRPVLGDDRGPDYGTDPSQSRLSVFVPIDGDTALTMESPSTYIDEDGSTTTYPPSESNRVRVFRGNDGVIKVIYDVTISGDLEGKAARLNGEITFTPDEDGTYSASGMRDGFPSIEAYHVDVQGKATQILNRPSRRDNHRDLFAIEPSDRLGFFSWLHGWLTGDFSLPRIDEFP